MTISPELEQQFVSAAERLAKKLDETDQPEIDVLSRRNLSRLSLGRDNQWVWWVGEHAIELGQIGLEKFIFDYAHYLDEGYQTLNQHENQEIAELAGQYVSPSVIASTQEGQVRPMTDEEIIGSRTLLSDEEYDAMSDQLEAPYKLLRANYLIQHETRLAQAAIELLNQLASS